MIALAIGCCEAGFWVVLGAGLACRYRWGRPRAGAALLACVPAVDLVLLIITAVDLRRGAAADATHGLAAVYLGFSVALGPSFVRAADRRVGTRAPAVRPSRAERERREWHVFGLACLAAGISALLLLAEIAVADGDGAALAGWYANLGAVLLVWFVAGPLVAAVQARRQN